MKQVTVVLVCLILSSFAWSGAIAQTDLALKGVGFRLGLVDPEDVDATWQLGALAELGLITPKIGLETYFDFWSRSEDVFGGGEISLRDFVFGARCKYLFSVSNPKLQPFAGGGLGFHIFRAGMDTPPVDYGGGVVVPGVSVSDTEIKVGLDIGGGFALDVKPNIAVLTEAWYSMVSEVSQLSIKAGVLFKLGR